MRKGNFRCPWFPRIHFRWSSLNLSLLDLNKLYILRSVRCLSPSSTVAVSRCGFAVSRTVTDRPVMAALAAESKGHDQSAGSWSGDSEQIICLACSRNAPLVISGTGSRWPARATQSAVLNSVAPPSIARHRVPSASCASSVGRSASPSWWLCPAASPSARSAPAPGARPSAPAWAWPASRLADGGVLTPDLVRAGAYQVNVGGRR